MICASTAESRRTIMVSGYSLPHASAYDRRRRRRHHRGVVGNRRGDRSRIRPPRLPIGASGPPAAAFGTWRKNSPAGRTCCPPISPTATNARPCSTRWLRSVSSRTSWSTTPAHHAGPGRRGESRGRTRPDRVDVAAVVDLCSRSVPSMVKRGRERCSTSHRSARSAPCPARRRTVPPRRVLSYTQAMREELRGAGVTAAALCPGPCERPSAGSGIPEEEARSRCRNSCGRSDAVAKAAVDGLASGKGVIIAGLPQRVASCSTIVSRAGLDAAHGAQPPA